jgi:hypothetical protein
MIRAKDVPDYYSFVYVTFSFPPSEIGNPLYIETEVASPGTPNQHDVATLLGRPAGTGCIVNDGPGDLLIDISYDGQTFTEDVRLKSYEILDLTGLRTYKLRVDATKANTKYRILAI